MHVPMETRMGTTTTVRRSFFSLRRYGIPTLIIVLAALAVAGFWLAPGLARDSRVGNSFFTGTTVLLLLTAWVVLLSGFRWYARIAGVVPLLTFLALLATGHVVFDGDMVPSLRAPWENRAAAVEEDRRQQQR